MKYSEIIPGRLYAGKRLCDAKNWEELHRLGVDAIVNIRSRPDRIPLDFPPIPMLFFKLSNKEKPSLRRLHAFVSQAVRWLNEGHTLYVHDVGGRNRLGFFLTALFMCLYQIPYQQALQTVKQQRPQLSPRRQFVKLLHDYERELGL
jgi:protein-tyrosine phosphatase